jgi:hypothetical protein
VPLHDVWTVDLSGGGPGRTLADVRLVHDRLPQSRLAAVLFGVRRLIGRLFAWDRSPMRPQESVGARLSEDDRRASQPATGTRVGAFLLVYQHPTEALLETRNATVHGFVCLALAPRPEGYRLYLAVYVRPVSWLTRPYLLAIEPFRRFLLYPAMRRRIRRAWRDAYTGAVPSR